MPYRIDHTKLRSCLEFFGFTAALIFGTWLAVNEWYNNSYTEFFHMSKNHATCTITPTSAVSYVEHSFGPQIQISGIFISESEFPVGTYVTFYYPDPILHMNSGKEYLDVVIRDKYFEMKSFPCNHNGTHATIGRLPFQIALSIATVFAVSIVALICAWFALCVCTDPLQNPIYYEPSFRSKTD